MPDRQPLDIFGKLLLVNGVQCYIYYVLPYAAESQILLVEIIFPWDSRCRCFTLSQYVVSAHTSSFVISSARNTYIIVYLSKRFAVHFSILQTRPDMHLLMYVGAFLYILKPSLIAKYFPVHIYIWYSS